MFRFLQTLTGNLVFLSTVMPLVGVFLVAASRGSGAAGIRRTACTNAALTLIMALSILAMYPVAGLSAASEAEPDENAVFQMVTARSLPLMPEPDRGAGRWQLLIPGLLTGVDGATAVLMCLFCGLMLAAILAAGGEHHRHPALLYGGLLLWQALQLLSLVSLDFRLTVLTGAASLPVLFLLAGMWGGAERRQTTVTLTSVLAVSIGLEAAAVLLLLDATIPVVGEILGTVRASSALLPERLQLLLNRDVAAEQWWLRVSSLAFPLLLASLLLRLGLAPLHGWFLTVFRQLPVFLKILLPGWLLASGFSLAARLLPLCQGHWGNFSDGLLWYGVIGSGFVILRAAGTRSVSDRSPLLLSAAGGLMLAALASSPSGGMQTALLLAVTSGLSFAVTNGQSPVDSMSARLPPRLSRNDTTTAGTSRGMNSHLAQTAAGSVWPGLYLRTALFSLAGLIVGIPLVAGATATPAGLLNLGQPPCWLGIAWLGFISLLCSLPAAARGIDSTAGYRLAAALPAVLLAAVVATPARLTSRLAGTAARFQQLTGSQLETTSRISSAPRSGAVPQASALPGIPVEAAAGFRLGSGHQAASAD